MRCSGIFPLCAVFLGLPSAGPVVLRISVFVLPFAALSLPCSIVCWFGVCCVLLLLLLLLLLHSTLSLAA